MKTHFMFSLLFFALICGSAGAQGDAPVPVSPAKELGTATVRTACPTFSWTSVGWARSYRVEVFPVLDYTDHVYSKVASRSQPVLVKEIPGAASSWTPSTDESLGNDGAYIWFVQALDGYGNGEWSLGKTFMIETGAGFAALEEAVGDALTKHGIDQRIIADVMDDVKRIHESDGALEAGDSIPISVQGHESDSNTWYGQNAGANVTTAAYNALFGYYAGFNLTTGGSNTILGSDAGGTITGANNNTFVGHSAGSGSTSGNSNTLIGYETGYYNLDGVENVYLGAGAGYKNSSGDYNTFIGSYSGNSNNNFGSSYNTMLGHSSGYSNTTGYSNTFIGYRAGYSNTSGLANIFVGRSAGQNNTEGNNNVFLGRGAGNSNTTGIQNTYLGNRAGYSNTTGTNNVFVGFYAGYNETGSDKLYIDNSDTSSPLIWGDFSSDIFAVNGKIGVNTNNPGFPMEMKQTGTNASVVVNRTDGVTNYINATDSFGNFGTVTNHPLRLVTNSQWNVLINTDRSLTMRNGASCTAGGVWTNASSRDLKENIHDLTIDQALGVLEGLHPVSYHYKADQEDQHLGFIAEDVPELVATKDRKGMSPMDVVAVLTKVVQELRRSNEDLRREIEELKTTK